MTGGLARPYLGRAKPSGGRRLVGAGLSARQLEDKLLGVSRKNNRHGAFRTVEGNYVVIPHGEESNHGWISDSGT